MTQVRRLRRRLPHGMAGYLSRSSFRLIRYCWSKGMVDEVLGVDSAVVERAKQMVLEYRQLSARHAVHLSVMEQNGIATILSFDPGFEMFPGIVRMV